MFEPITDMHAVSEVIRDAVAPIFLLTGIGSILGVMVQRFARAIDRAREMNEFTAEKRKKFNIELVLTVRRMKWLQWAIGFATLAALLVCVSVTFLFLSVEGSLKMSQLVLVSFISSMGAIIVALLCFLREIILTSKNVLLASSAG